MSNKIYVTDIRPGQKVEGHFCVASKSLRKTKAGSPFLVLVLGDRTGQIEARIWENAQKLNDGFDKGDIIFLEADAVEFNGQCQLKVNSFQVVEQEDIDPSHFLPVSSCDLEQAWKTCRKAIKRVKDASLRVVLEEIFQDRRIKEAFLKAPAAKKMHHAYIGGLLEHSAGLVELSMLLVDKYQYLDRDILLSASLLHDIGKIRELSWSRPPIDYTDEGRLLGHITLGMEMIERACLLAKVNPESRKVKALKHVVLSHHGRLEFGSPVLPMTEEAMVFHMIDDLDAKLNFLSILKNKRENAEEWGWSDYQRLFERYFFLPPLSETCCVRPKKSSVEESNQKDSQQQPLLWDIDEP